MILRTRSCGNDFIINKVKLDSSFPPGRNLARRNDLYDDHSCTSIEGASWRGQPVNILT